MSGILLDEAFYPLEIFVTGTPTSLQGSTRSKERWKATIRDAARDRIRETDELGFLDRRPLAVTIFYFSAEPMEGDVDNIVKPILDALTRVAYMDDNDVERVVVQKFEPQEDWLIQSPSEHLATASAADPPVVYVRIDDDRGWRTL